MDQSPPIAPRLLDWHARHGRHDLPWQAERSAYRVWISEVMLQQTQVTTVIGYFERFIGRFPDVGALASAPLDEVLHLWSGLGYYARARNLHRAARVICDEHQGLFPTRFEAVAALPGIGRSTAGAILAISAHQRHAIVDGNVRRVLARLFGLAGRPGEREFEARLWLAAERETPVLEVATYTQAIMDLGATLCTRRNPDCTHCPLAADCIARLSGRQHELPARRRVAARGQREVTMLLVYRGDGSIWLEKRPSRGIWGGLWSPPEFPSPAEAERLVEGAADGRLLPAIDHAFTHFDLRILPLLAAVPEQWDPLRARVTESAGGLWYNPRQPERVGVPAPVASLLAALPDMIESRDIL